MNRRMLLLPVAAAAIGVALWRGTPATAPACTWRTGTGTEVVQGQNFDKLAPEAPVRLSVHTDTPQHLYVWSHSAEDGTLLLFPSPKLQTDRKNPLPAGQSVLPGSFEGKELAWTTRSGILATTTYIAFASTEPLPELDQLAAKVRQWSNAVFADRSMQVTKPAEGQDVLGKPREGWADPLLQTAADQLRDQTEPNGPMQPLRDRPGVWISSWKVLQTR
jgi:hypothetical protein